MAAEHPLLTTAVVAVLVIVAASVIWKLYGYLKAGLSKLKRSPSPAGP
jgi:hypothetical protein